MTYNKIELSPREIEILEGRLNITSSTIAVKRAIDKVNEDRRERAREILAVIAADDPTRNPASGHPSAPPLASPFQFNVPNVHPVRELALRLAVESRERGETAAETVAAAEAFAQFLSEADGR